LCITLVIIHFHYNIKLLPPVLVFSNALAFLNQIHILASSLLCESIAVSSFNIISRLMVVTESGDAGIGFYNTRNIDSRKMLLSIKYGKKICLKGVRLD
jgi:hypothetical protein